MNTPKTLSKVDICASTYPYYAKYKDRSPDPGMCLVRVIDFETGRADITNGRYSYFPKLHEVDFYINEQAQPRS